MAVCMAVFFSSSFQQPGTLSRGSTASEDNGVGRLGLLEWMGPAARWGGGEQLCPVAACLSPLPIPGPLLVVPRPERVPDLGTHQEMFLELFIGPENPRINKTHVLITVKAEKSFIPDGIIQLIDLPC